MPNITKMDIWSCEVKDHVGATTGLFKALADAGVDLTFALARRHPDKPGTGILFVSPIQGPAQEQAAQRVNFTKRHDVVGVRVEGTNKAGIGFQLTQALSADGLNLRAISAHVIGKQFSVVFVFDNVADAEKGLQALKKIKA